MVQGTHGGLYIFLKRSHVKRLDVKPNEGGKRGQKSAKKCHILFQ
jgi:hypothetical protein